VSIRRLIAEGRELAGSDHWDTLDVRSLLRRRHEATVSANAGGYQVPLGKPLRHPDLVGGVGAQDNFKIDPEYDGIYRKHYQRVKLKNK
jgi:hypothetical protein